MYRKLAVATSINAVIMFLLTYAMIAEVGHFHLNLNRVYMALMMAAPMVVVMLLVMRSMYENQRLNHVLLALFSGLFLLVFALARTQTPVGDGQFLRSMIPHHSSAILMCEESQITDPEIVELCGEIVQAQREEIRQMEDILARH